MVKRANATVSNISTANLSLLLLVEECLKVVNIFAKIHKKHYWVLDSSCSSCTVLLEDADLMR